MNLNSVKKRTRVVFIGVAGTFLLTAASLAVGSAPASAAPAGCTLYFTPQDANPNFTGAAGYCDRGTGTYNVSVRCDVPHFPDYTKYSPTVTSGHTTSVTCNFGNHATKAWLNKSS